MHEGPLPGCEVQRQPEVVDSTTGCIQPQRAKTGVVCSVGSLIATKGTPFQRAQAGLQLVQVKGLGQVIICARIEPQHTVTHSAACGQDQHGRGGLQCPQCGKHLQTIEPRQTEIQHDHIGSQRLPLGNGLQAICTQADMDAAAR